MVAVAVVRLHPKPSTVTHCESMKTRQPQPHQRNDGVLVRSRHVGPNSSLSFSLSSSSSQLVSLSHTARLSLSICLPPPPHAISFSLLRALSLAHSAPPAPLCSQPPYKGTDTVNVYVHNVHCDMLFLKKKNTADGSRAANDASNVTKTAVTGPAAATAAEGMLNGAPEVVADKAQELFELMCPHRRSYLLPHNLTQDLDDGVFNAEKSRAILTKAADAVVADLKTLSLQTASESTLRVDEALRTALTRSADDAAAAGAKDLAPLKHKLKCVDDLLKVYAHTTLSYCTLPIENEKAVVNMLSVMVVGPAIKYVKKAMATMCEHIEKDARIFQSEVARKGAQDKGNYDFSSKESAAFLPAKMSVTHTVVCIRKSVK